MEAGCGVGLWGVSKVNEGISWHGEFNQLREKRTRGFQREDQFKAILLPAERIMEASVIGIGVV